jgi:hypothetical protein
MSDAFNVALSALGSLFRKMDVTANNIANVNTNNFKKSRAEFEDVCPSTRFTRSGSIRLRPFPAPLSWKRPSLIEFTLDKETLLCYSSLK